MYKVTIMYPNEEGVRFDFDYYRNKHMKLVAEQLRPFGLTKTGVEKGISGGAGQSAPYVCVGYMLFDRADGYDEGVKAVGSVLRADIANYTNVTPTRLISELMD